MEIVNRVFRDFSFSSSVLFANNYRVRNRVSIVGNKNFGNYLSSSQVKLLEFSTSYSRLPSYFIISLDNTQKMSVHQNFSESFGFYQSGYKMLNLAAIRSQEVLQVP